MIYGFDVANPDSTDSPRLMWAVGCPNLNNDNDCTTGMTDIGQTWSAPRGVRIKGYSESDPVVIFGAGYDSCEDENSKAPTCTGSKGRAVYILKAETGELLKTFSFPSGRSIAADITLVDVNADGYVDYAYAADTGGNIYRMDFVDADRTPRALGNWTARRVAYTNDVPGAPSDNGRKFLFAPAVFVSGAMAYLAIGSGDREHPLQTQYPYQDNVVNRFYVYKDDLSVNSVTADAINLDGDGMRGLTANTTCDETPVLPSSSYKGWYMKLNQNGQGEQTVTSALIAGGMVNFSTNRPVTTSGACTALLGEARGYSVNLFTRSGGIGVADACGGASSGIFAGGGLPPSPVQATVPIGKGRYTVCIGCATETTGNSVINSSQVKFLVQPKRKKIYSNVKTDN